MMAYKAVSAVHEDSIPLDVLSIILTSGKTSRLYKALLETGLASGVDASNTALRDPGLFYVFAVLNPDSDHDAIESAIRGELHNASSNGVSQSEVDSAVSQLRAMEAYSRDGAFSIVQQLNESIASGDWRLYTEYLKKLEDVGVEDIQRVAQKYLVDDRATIGQYIPA